MGDGGKAEGQNGFKLSVFGYDPRADLVAITQEGRGRRVFLPAPERSLLLRKATATEPHGGGRRTYRMIEKAQRGLFAQLVIVPLFTKHHILTQVAGHEMAVIRILPPLVVTEGDLEEFADVDE